MASELLSGKLLFEALNSGATLASIVDPLIGRSQEGEYTESISAIINMCFKVAGIEFEADEAAFTSDADVNAVLEEVLARVGGDSACFSLLLSKDAKLKRLRKNFGEFFRCVAMSAQSFKLTEFIPTLVTWLVCMNGSKARSFRHVALIASCGIIDALHEQLAEIDSQRAQGSARSNKALLAPYAKLTDLLSDIFTQTVTSRIKDIAPEIRLIALQKLKVWFYTLPDRYCTSEYLVYVRFALCDKKPEMRIEALEIIAYIFCTVPGGPAKLQKLFAVCMKRLVEMCKDVDTKCAHAAIKLFTVLIRHEYAIRDDWLDAIFEGLLDDRSIIRSAVGAFLKHFVSVNTKKNKATPFALIIALMKTLELQCPAMVEEYLIDSLWSTEDPPLEGDEAKVATMISSNDAAEVIMGLRVAGVLLKRANGGEASLGPTPKDDLYLVSKSKNTTDKRDKMVAALSKAVIEKLPAVLKANSDNQSIVLAVAAVIEHCSLDACPAASLKKAIKSFREVCRECHFTFENSLSLSAAWRKFAFTQYVESSSGEFEFKELIKETTKAIEGRSKGSTAEWIRMAFISSVVHSASSWDGFLSALLSAVDKSDLERVRSISAVCFNSVMWAVAADARDGTNEAIEKAGVIVPILLDFVKGCIANSDPEVNKLSATILAYCGDLLALPSLLVSNDTIATLVHGATKSIEHLSAAAKHIALTSKDLSRSVATGGDATVWENYAVTRSELASLEKICATVIGSVSRLFFLKKAECLMSFELFSVWTITPFKSTADMLKYLFHALRERLGGSGFEFEKSILLSCIQTNGTAAEANIGQLGSKLASIHFLPTDKYYDSCPQLVSYALEGCQAAPLLLHACAMYCSKLRQSDALAAFAQAKKLENQLLGNAYFATFMYNLAKAAKVADGKAVAKNTKRSREEQSNAEVDPELSEALAQSPLSSSAPTSEPHRKGGAKTEKRTTTPGGWRVNNTSTANLDERTLVATQEWE
eukprot:GILI01021483.1.p1 GENE.GILI01021483.1~~GILI01021483.1.p1  ORF type:complete len:988 (-),score=128.72 GILI01021483.1:103-3066(-)